MIAHYTEEIKLLGEQNTNRRSLASIATYRLSGKNSKDDLDIRTGWG
jgi:hypothetical protein